MGFRRFLFPETLRIPDSKYNRNISILRYFTGDTLLADGLIESGNIMKHIWKVGLTNLIPKSYSPKNILLLGLAGGSNAHLVSRLYKNAQITAVEIDPQMVEIAFKHFNLGKIKNLEIINGDALKFAADLKGSDHYDIILVDCFFGQEIPKRLESLDFIKNLVDHSTYTLINRLWHGKFLKISQDFINSLTPDFKYVSTFTGTNLVISFI